MAYQALRFPDFQPAMRVITAITNAEVAEVTTSFEHLYIDGIILRLFIPPDFGMVQANGLAGEITVTSPTTFTITINTLPFDAFVVPVDALQVAQAIPFGENNAILDAAVQNVLPY